MIRITPNDNLPARLAINEARELSANLIQNLFKKAPKPIRPITSHLATAQGKGVRTSMVLAAAVGDDNLVPKDTVLASTAIELFHMATLVHDDVIDNADSRRGIATVHTKFSKKEAVICGDYLFCIAISTISSIYEPYKDFMYKFSSAVEKVCLGELRQYSNNFNTDIGFNEYLRIIYGKTASLFYISAYAGGLIGKAEEEELKQIGKLGTYMGMIFQILDDCKDYMLEESEALKPTKTDIISGVVNLPLLMAFLKEPALRESAKYVASNPLEIRKIINDVYRLKGVPDSLAIANKYAAKAKKIIASLSNTRKSEELGKLLSSQLQVAESFAKA